MTDAPVGRASVTVNFECASSDEAKTLIEGWVLHPGCTVSVTYMEMGRPAMTDDSGAVVPNPEPEPMALSQDPPPEAIDGSPA